MIFSFNDHDKPDPEFWSQLKRRLPEEYTFPDLSFIRTLDPLLLSREYIMDIRSLGPELPDIDPSYWQAIERKLPQNYAIPDLTLIKRLCEL